jgi:hypothetical protein
MRVLVASVLLIACHAPDPRIADAKPEAVVSKRGPEPPKPVEPEPPKPTTAVEPPPPEPPEPPPVVAVDLTGYSRTCKKHADCMLVKSNWCSRCGCANEPIATSEEARFYAAARALECPPSEPLPGGAGCGGCIIHRPRCKQGTCVAK